MKSLRQGLGRQPQRPPRYARPAFWFSCFCMLHAMTTNAVHPNTIGIPNPNKTAASMIVMIPYRLSLSAVIEDIAQCCAR